MSLPRRHLAVCAVAAALLAAGCGGSTGATSRPRTAADLTNPRLAPEWSQWLVGPISLIATPAEVDAYLAISDDASAAAFEEAFWSRRDPDPARPGNPLLELFRRRAADADRRFSEAGYRGLRTHRGTLFVLHGEPESIEFEVNPQPRRPPVEVWTYPRDAGLGLNGHRPSELYRFIKQGDLTVFYQGPARDPDSLFRDMPQG
jgi:GWxTD domain-containing protein